MTPDDIAPELLDASVAELAARMAAGRTTSRRLVEGYLARIDQVDGMVNAVIELDPDALDTADHRDAERAAGSTRGPLHGIPVLLKDNIGTADRMQTTAGSLALVGHPPDQDATVAARLREAGAVVIGKSNLSEWANFRGSPSCSGWSGRGGLTRNPYVLDRTASGSSSGSGAAVSADLATVALGTETDGSILSPAAACGVVGLKPTVGLTSRAGVIPISHSQDTVGPMTRTVADAAAVLTVIAGPDPHDPATAGAPIVDYTRHLDDAALQGARIGVPRKGFSAFDGVTDAVTEQAHDALRRAGATLVEVDVPDVERLAAGREETVVLLSEFKHDIAVHLASLPDRPGVPRTLADLIAFDEQHPTELEHFGQELFEQAQATDGLSSADYPEARAQAQALGEALDSLLAEHDLVALVAPTMGPAGRIDLRQGESYSGGSTSRLLAVAGRPGITVPMGFAEGLPLGLCFLGAAWSEPVLIGLAHAYEQATKHRRRPTFLATGGPAGDGRRAGWVARD